jgi:hypothetical protein
MSIGIMLSVQTVHADSPRGPVVVGVVAEGGAWVEIVWKGAAVEVDVPVTNTLAFRGTARHTTSATSTSSGSNSMGPLEFSGP